MAATVQDAKVGFIGDAVLEGLAAALSKTFQQPAQMVIQPIFHRDINLQA
ncbi:MAG: hypothetical protein LBC25_02060 [Holosporales bacterium]|jgi:hypothetical protein|nr:hypothetical protein [Holosporales bacterium]